MEIAARPIHLHGPGRAATSLGVMLRAAGARVVSTSGGRGFGGREAEALLGAAPWTPAPPTLPAGVLVIVGAPDDELIGAAVVLANAALPADALVIHLSGICSLGVLDALVPGVAVGAMHPLRAFPTRDPGGRDLEGAAVAIEAPEATVRTELTTLAATLGGRPFVLRAGARPLYHLAASLASNGLVGVFDLASELFTRAGVPDAVRQEGLVALVRGTLDDLAATDPAEALTGPVVRGDVGVLNEHLAALRAERPDREALYRELVAALIEVASRREDASRSRAVAAWLEKLQP